MCFGKYISTDLMAVVFYDDTVLASPSYIIIQINMMSIWD